MMPYRSISFLDIVRVSIGEAIMSYGIHPIMVGHFNFPQLGHYHFPQLGHYHFRETRNGEKL